MKKYIHILIVVLSVFAMSSCSGDAEMLSTSKEQGSVDDYKFVINVTKGDNGSSRAVNKTEWEEGDVIEAIANREKFTLTYQNNGYWSLSNRYGFWRERGDSTIFACYGLTDSRNINHELFLYTDEGTYKYEDNIIYINLNMNKRPFARLTVKGVDKDFAIAGAVAPRIVDFEWKALGDTAKNATAAEYDESTQTAIYYGIVSPTNNQTKILLFNQDGVGYSRIYNKVMKASESIVLNGPKSSEADSWTKHTLVKNITLSETRVSTCIDEAFDLTATVEPADADNADLKWYSSDESVASVDDNGHVTVKGVGEALITVETKDGTISTSCAVVSYYHANIYMDNLVCSNGNGVFDVSFYVSSGYEGSICLTKLYLKNSATGKVHLLKEVTDGELKYSSDKHNYNASLNFSNLPSGTYNLWADYTCNGKTYSITREYQVINLK